METEKAKELLSRQIEQTKSLDGFEAYAPVFKKWHRDTEIALEKIFGKQSRHLEDFNEITYTCGVYFSGMAADADVKACRGGLANARQILQSMIEEISEYGFETSKGAVQDSFTGLVNFCERFHLVARQMRSRHDNRATLDVEDEYDTQDLLHALLQLRFDDIRPEEWTPSYAGGSSRMDFLLKQEKIVIEVKKTRKGLAAKEVGE
jgi:hypothetical protein